MIEKHANDRWLISCLDDDRTIWSDEMTILSMRDNTIRTMNGKIHFKNEADFLQFKTCKVEEEQPLWSQSEIERIHDAIDDDDIDELLK
jgi:hypothetical protein